MKLLSIECNDNEFAVPSISDIKSYLKINNNEDDLFLEECIRSVMDICERYTCVSLGEKVWSARYLIKEKNGILPRYPINEIISITYNDKFFNIIDIDKKYCEFFDDTFRLKGNNNLDKGILSIKFKAGYKNIPANLLSVLRFHIAHLYDNSEDVFSLRHYDIFKKIKI